VDYERVTRLLEKRVIEIAPLAFMRGRTLSDAFVILDEAQKHDQRADEDVSDAHRFWIEGGDYRRRDADRSADGETKLAWSKLSACSRTSKASSYLLQRERRRASQARADDHQGVRDAYQKIEM
jgi:hypothetical protein